MEVNFRYYKNNYIFPIIVLSFIGINKGLACLWAYDLFQGVGAFSIIGVAITSYDKYWEKLKWIQFLTSVPDINGTYTGSIQYHWDGEDGTKACDLEIKQTASRLKVTSIFFREGENDTRSESTEAYIKTDEHGYHKLYVYYHNRGSNQNGDTLNAHDGMNVFDIKSTDNNIQLEGYYFTNRDPQTKGSISVTQKQGEN